MWMAGSSRKPRRCNDGRGNPNGPLRPAEHRDDVGFAKALFALMPVDMTDPDAVQSRYFELLDLCEEYGRAMTIETIAMGYDTSRAEIVALGKGKRCRLANRLSEESARTFQKVLKSVAGIWATHMGSGDYKQPLTGIFIGKNNFGYGDVTETVIRHETVQQGPSREELEAKYQAALPKETPIDAVVEDVERPSETPEGPQEAS